MENTKDMSTTYSETLVILDIIGDDYKNKIPKKLIAFLERHKAEDYHPQITYDDFINGYYSQRTKSFMAYLFIQYWATVEEKTPIIEKLKEYEASKYDYSKMFRKQDYQKVEEINKESKIEEDTNTNVALTNVNGFSNILNKIKEIYNKIFNNIFKK